ncbi:MAG: ATP-binding protein, partial [Acidobacteria bacterium]
PTDQLAREMISKGLRAVVTCVDPEQLPASFAGREFNEEFLSSLPADVDPCGERGEFHTFAFDGPMFSKPVNIEVGEITEREGFVYADVLPASSAPAARANAGV